MSATEKVVLGIPSTKMRSVGLDAFRGLAILAMVADHVTLVSAGPHIIRDTVGRLAMPAFFLLGGHLARRVTWRHAGILAVGLFLPLFVPWIDSPNVLCWYVIGAAMLRCAELSEISPAIIVVIGLGLAANGPGWLTGYTNGSYWPYGLWGLMAVGRLVPREWFTWTLNLPAWLGVVLAYVGRAPLRWYVGHLLVLQLVVLLTGTVVR